MAILSGKRLGPYEILSAIGAGGMGEVEALCGHEAADCAAGSWQPKSRGRRGI
jgi:hypothetical protein